MSGSALPTVPALGRSPRLPTRSIVLRAVVLAGLLVLALVVRASGLLQSGASELPPLPAAASVLPGVFRSATPAENDYVQLRDTFGAKGIAAVVTAPATQPSAEEQAVVPALGMRLHTVTVAADAAPDAAQLAALREFVRGAGGPVLLHDDTGTGPVVVTAALLQLLDGRPIDDVRSGLGGAQLTPAQDQALTDLAGALAGTAGPSNPYASLER